MSRFFFIYRWFLFLILFPRLLFAQAPSSMGTEQFNGTEVVANEVLVKFKSTAAEKRGELTTNAALQLEDQSIHEIQNAHAIYEYRLVGGDRTYLFHSRTETARQLIKEISTRGDVEYVQADHVFHTATDPNDTYYAPYQWPLKNTGQTINQTGTVGDDIKAYQAWNLTTGSKGNVIGLTDEGVDYNHPDLSANIWSATSSFTVLIGGISYTCPAGSHGFTSLSGRHSCNPYYVGSGDWHGTFVAGLMGALGNNQRGIAGVNWTTSILVSAWLQNGSGNESDALDAIEFIVQTKAQGLVNVRTINASWADPSPGFDQALFNEINRAGQYDILFVAAAGNSGINMDNTAFDPASFGAPIPYCDPTGHSCNAPSVISVAASDNQDHLGSLSNYGAHSVYLAAPGVNITSTLPQTNANGYCTPDIASIYCDGGTGTSAAAPHVTGVASLALSRCADLTTPQLKSLLLSNIDAIQALSGKTITGGRLNAYKAVSSCGYAVSVTSSGLGTVTSGSQGTVGGGLTAINCGNICSVVFKSTTYGGQPVTLAAVPASGYYFAGWSGACTGSSCQLVGTTISLAVTATFMPLGTSDFSLGAAPSSSTQTLGTSTSYAITVNRTGGFSNSVTFSVSGLPNGATSSVVPSNTTGNSATLAVTTTSSSPTGTFPLTISGVSGALTRTTQVTLVVIPPQVVVSNWWEAVDYLLH